LGRDISRTLIVDNVAENFQLQPDNGVFIRTWIDDPTDNALEELAPLLKEVAVRKVRDVREALRVFRIQMMEQVQKGILKPQLSLAEGLVEVENNPEDVYDSPIKQQ
jgi:CTD small phosphatase-like protein 2